MKDKKGIIIIVGCILATISWLRYIKIKDFYVTSWDIISLISAILSIGTFFSLIDIIIRKITEPFVDKYLKKYTLGFYKQNKENKKLFNLVNCTNILPCKLWKSDDADDEYKCKLFIGYITSTDNPDKKTEKTEGYFVLDKLPYSEICHYVIKCWLKEWFNFCDYPFLRLDKYYKDEQFKKDNIKMVDRNTINAGIQSGFYFFNNCEKYSLKNNRLYPIIYMFYITYLSDNQMLDVKSNDVHPTDKDEKLCKSIYNIHDKTLRK